MVSHILGEFAKGDWHAEFECDQVIAYADLRKSGEASITPPSSQLIPIS